MQKFYITKASIEESFHSMKYNFIEIGTSNFDTLIENAHILEIQWGSECIEEDIERR